jgi:hypothetical protein
MSNNQIGKSTIARNRRRTKIIVWSIIGMVFIGGAFALWQLLSSGPTWRALLVIAIAILFGWQIYRQASAVSRN